MLAEEDKNAEEKSPLDGRWLCWAFSSCATGEVPLLSLPRLPPEQEDPPACTRHKSGH